MTAYKTVVKRGTYSGFGLNESYSFTVPDTDTDYIVSAYATINSAASTWPNAARMIGPSRITMEDGSAIDVGGASSSTGSNGASGLWERPVSAEWTNTSTSNYTLVEFTIIYITPDA